MNNLVSKQPVALTEKRIAEIRWYLIISPPDHVTGEELRALCDLAESARAHQASEAPGT